ncbi:MAG: diguanylate cyclase [Bacillota bacterium]
MEVFNTRYQNKAQLYNFIDQSNIENSDRLLIQIFTDYCSQSYISKLLAEIKEKLPAAKIIGSTSAEGIVNGERVKGETVISFTNFIETDLEAGLVETTENSYFEQVQKLGTEIIESETQVVILFADGLHANGEEVLAGLEKVNPQIMIAGGKAGRSDEDKDTFIFTADGISNQGIVGVSLSNNNLIVKNGYGFGWQQIGKTMTVTKADGNRIYELDNENIYDVYERYLGTEMAAELPRTAEMEFPIVLNREGVLLIRGAVEAGSNFLAFTGRIHEGEKVRFGYGNPQLILQNAAQDLGEVVNESVEGVYIYSCVSRASALGQDIELEINPLEKEAPTAGFFTFGEFYHRKQKNYLFNKTTTVLALTEGNERVSSKSKNYNFKLPNKWHYRTIKALANLAQSVTNELEARNRELKKLNKEVNKNLTLSETGEALVEIGCQQLEVQWGGFILKSEDYLANIILRGFSKPEEKQLNRILSQGEIINGDKSEQEIVIVNDNSSFLLSELDFKSALLAPINMNQRQAVLFFLHPRKDYFSVKDRLLIEPLIDQAPLAIEKANTFERMEHNLAELSTLQQTSNQINSTLDLEEVFDLTIDVIKGTMGVSVVGLFLVEEELKLAAQSGLQEQPRLIEFARKISLEALNKEQIVIKNELEEKFVTFGQSVLNSCLSAPIKIRDEVIGAVFSGQTEYNSIFKLEDKKFLNILSNQVAIGIENARMYEEMEQMAIQDGLTKLYNHSYFQEQLSTKIKWGQKQTGSLGLLLLDIDDFKYFNDQYGHQAGDYILRELAVELKELTRESDLLARYGGEEFVIIVSEITESEIKQLGERINSQVRAMRLEYDENSFQITISIGGSIYEAGKTKEQLIKEADQALYRAKEEGKDQFCFY